MSADPSPTSRASSQRKARELVANVATELRLPPDIVALRRILDDANATPEQLIETLGRLPALTGRLLELIELPLHRQESDAWTLPRMVHQLGAQRILDLALVVMVSDGLARVELATERCGFWPLAVRTALVSRGIARQCGRPESDRSMVAGLLMPTGLALLWHADPAGMQRANQILEQEGTAVRAAQRAATGTDCVAVTTALARQWQLPTPIQRALACCDEPARAVPHHFEAAVLRLAQSACDFPGAGEPPDPLALSLLNLTPACVHTVAANTELYYQAYLDFMARRTYPPSTASDPDPVMPAAP